MSAFKFAKCEKKTDSVVSTSSHDNAVANPLNFPKLIQPCPPGLPNLGNTCYINATLQCLLTIHPLIKWLLESSPCAIDPGSCASIDAQGTQLTPILADLVGAIFRNHFQTELERFREVIGQLVKEFKEPREQDAQEFLLFLLNRLHDENVAKSQPKQSGESDEMPSSEIRKILSGQLQTQVTCSSCCTKTTSTTSQLFFKTMLRKNGGKSIVGGGSEVFLSLSLPISTSLCDSETTMGNDQNTGCQQRVVVNEVVEKPSPFCHQRLLCVDSQMDIESVYKQLSTTLLETPARIFSNGPPSYATASTSGHNRNSSHYHQDTGNTSSPPIRSTSSVFPIPQHRFVLVQANASGFGDWFLEKSGRAGNLLDGLNVENDFRSSNPSSAINMKSNILVEDALFLVHLESLTPSPTSNSPSLGMADSYQPPPKYSFDDQSFYDQSSNEDESCLRLLLIHVTESIQVQRNNHLNAYQAQTEHLSTRGTQFQRFSPPLTIQVAKDIEFDALRWEVVRSLFEFDGSDALRCNHLIESGSCQSLRFVIVDAGPGETCEIVEDPTQMFPLLHPTVEVSSINVPSWITTNNCNIGDGGNTGPKMLRLLVVWPSQPRNLLSSLKLSIESGLLPVSSEASSTSRRSSTHSINASASQIQSVMHPKNWFEHIAKSRGSTIESVSVRPTSPPGELKIESCLKTFVETEQLGEANSGKCPSCNKQQTTVSLKTSLKKAPKYLLLHLKRFVQGHGQNSLMKITSLVTYPTEGLDLSFMMDCKEKSSKGLNSSKKNYQASSPSSNLLYDLVAVCSHKGSLETGHITAYCRNLFNNQWWHYNDLRVQKASSDQIVMPGAYILFYKQREAYPTDIHLLQDLHNLTQFSSKLPYNIPLLPRNDSREQTNDSVTPSVTTRPKPPMRRDRALLSPSLRPQDRSSVTGGTPSHGPRDASNEQHLNVSSP